MANLLTVGHVQKMTLTMKSFNKRIEQIREDLYDLYELDPPEPVKRHLDDAFLSVTRIRYKLKDLEGERD